MVLKFSTSMYHPTLAVPWSKEQGKNRLSQVRNQSSSLIPDRQDVGPGGGGEGVRTWLCVRVRGYLKELGPSPPPTSALSLSPDPISHVESLLTI